LANNIEGGINFDLCDGLFLDSIRIIINLQIIQGFVDYLIRDFTGEKLKLTWTCQIFNYNFFPFKWIMGYLLTIKMGGLMKYKLKNLIFKSGRSQWQICRELNWPEAKLSRFVTGGEASKADFLSRFL